MTTQHNFTPIINRKLIHTNNFRMGKYFKTEFNATGL